MKINTTLVSKNQLSLIKFVIVLGFCKIKNLLISLNHLEIPILVFSSFLCWLPQEWYIYLLFRKIHQSLKFEIRLSHNFKIDDIYIFHLQHSSLKYLVFSLSVNNDTAISNSYIIFFFFFNWLESFINKDASTLHIELKNPFLKYEWFIIIWKECVHSLSLLYWHIHFFF